MRERLNWIIGFAVVASVFAAWLRSEPPRAERGKQAAYELPEASSAEMHRKGQASASPAEVRSMKRQLAELQDSLEEVRRASKPEKSEALPAQDASRPKLTPEEELEAARAWADGYSAQLDDIFEQQAESGAWSRDAEGKAGDVLKYLGGTTANVRVRCGATLCKGEIVHSARGGHQALLQRAYDGMGWEGPTFLLPVNDDGLESTVIYLSKPGTELPPPESDV